MDIKLTRLQEMLDSSENIVFFGGAGVSTERGRESIIGTHKKMTSLTSFPSTTISLMMERQKRLWSSLERSA